MKFGFDYHANQEYLYISPNITYSPYLTPYLSKANSRTVALVATNKNTGESKEVTSWKDTNEYQYFYASNYCYLEISEPLDFELYEYTIEVTFYENQKGNTSFKGGDGEVKIICELENKDTLESFFAPYQDLPLILVQKEIAYEKPALVFDMHQLNAMKDILDQLITVSDELLGERNGRWYTISIDEILFVEGLSRDTYVYTMNGSYRIKERISTLEEQWGNYSYTRISKSMIVNTKQVQYIIPTIASKLILHMSNHMEIEVSRAYANQFKKKMKVKK